MNDSRPCRGAVAEQGPAPGSASRPGSVPTNLCFAYQPVFSTFRNAPALAF
jgi:hypothetical protein